MPAASPAYRLLVFDWDGTLMDSVGTIVACARAAICELGLDPPEDGVIRATVGLGLRETVERLRPGCDEALFERIVGAYRTHWHGTYRDLPLLFPEVRELLAELAAAGYLLAVATGKSRRGLEHALEQSGLAGRFHATRTADEAPSKPHPRMLWDLLEELGARPDEALMVGDTTHDLAMARSAGVAAVGVASGTQPRAELERLAPLACLERVGELSVWLGAPAATAPSAR
ncbi:MAG TPA: HAD-IA family hydrolase [Thermoanaerobaculia bacterium]|nr:HAD-IA family hydrolase [Thermoanaerobaculia bacterium]